MCLRGDFCKNVHKMLMKEMIKSPIPNFKLGIQSILTSAEKLILHPVIKVQDHVNIFGVAAFILIILDHFQTETGSKKSTRLKKHIFFVINFSLPSPFGASLPAFPVFHLLPDRPTSSLAPPTGAAHASSPCRVCVLNAAVALKDTLLTAMGHCSPGIGWHTLMNDAALSDSAAALCLTHEDT